MGRTRIFGAALDGGAREDRIGDHQFPERRRRYPGDGAAGKDAVGRVGPHRGGALLKQRRGGVAQRAAGIDDVVEEDAVLSLDTRR